MSLFKTKTASELAGLARGLINGNSGHHQQAPPPSNMNNMHFDVNAFMESNPHLKQQQPAYQVYQGQPHQGHQSMYLSRPGTSHGHGALPTPTHTPPPPVLPTLSTGNADTGPKKFEMLYTNSLTSPGVQNAYVTQLPFGRAAMSAQQIREQQLRQVQQQQQQQQQQLAQQGQLATSQQYIQQQSQPFTAQSQAQQLAQQQARTNRRFSMQHVPMSYSQDGSPAPSFPSQLMNSGTPPPQARRMSPSRTMQICSPPPFQMESTPEPMQILPSNDAYMQDAAVPQQSQQAPPVDRTAMNIRPMDLTEFLRITGPDDNTRHIPQVDMTEGTVSEFQHPDKESVVGQSMPLMNKLAFSRPCEEAFDSLMAWNGRRLTPYPTQSLGRTIRSEEDVADMATDFWAKPIHAATLTWLQAIDSARLDNRKGASTRFTMNNYTNMDGIVEGEEVDPSMLHFGKLFTLYPPVLETSARKQVCFFMEFCSPGVLSGEGAEDMWTEGPLKNMRNVGGHITKESIHSFYSATRQIATTAKTTKCRAGALCDYETIVLFYFNGPMDTWTTQESKAEVKFLKRTDPEARYLIAELMYRSMIDMSERLNLGDLKKVVEANGQQSIRNGDYIHNSVSVIH